MMLISVLVIFKIENIMGDSLMSFILLIGCVNAFLIIGVRFILTNESPNKEESEKETPKNTYENKGNIIRKCVRCRKRPRRNQHSDYDGLCNTCHDIASGLS
jgi:hypothetical protein